MLQPSKREITVTVTDLADRVFPVQSKSNFVSSATLIGDNIFLGVLPKDEKIDLERDCEVILPSGKEKIKIVLQNKKLVIFRAVDLEIKVAGSILKLCNPVFLLEGDSVITISGFDKRIRLYRATERFIENFKIKLEGTGSDEDLLIGAPVFNLKGSLISIFVSEYGYIGTANFFKVKAVFDSIKFL